MDGAVKYILYSAASVSRAYSLLWMDAFKLDDKLFDKSKCRM
jgi:hypothetical protein